MKILKKRNRMVDKNKYTLDTRFNGGSTECRIEAKIPTAIKSFDEDNCIQLAKRRKIGGRTANKNTIFFQFSHKHCIHITTQIKIVNHNI